MKKLLIIMIGMFLISFASAAVEGNYDYLAQYYTDVNITETCEAEGFPCDNTFGCNITIINPIEQVVVRDATMTKSFPNYIYSFTNTSELGNYKISVYCTNGTFKGLNDEIILKVTTNGNPESIKVQIFMLLISLVVFILALYLRSHPIGFIAGVLFLLTGIYQMAYGFGDIANMYTQAMAYIVIAFGMFIMLIAGIEWISDMEGS